MTDTLLLTREQSTVIGTRDIGKQTRKTLLSHDHPGFGMFDHIVQARVVKAGIHRHMYCTDPDRRTVLLGPATD